jgi:hypothetical protein
MMKVSRQSVHYMRGENMHPLRLALLREERDINKRNFQKETYVAKRIKELNPVITIDDYA